MVSPSAAVATATAAAMFSNASDVANATEKSDADLQELELFRYYTEGVLLMPVSLFGILGK